MRREDLSKQLIEVYESKAEGLEVFKLKPWDVKVGDTLCFRPMDEVLTLVEADKAYCLNPKIKIIQKIHSKYKLLVNARILDRIHSHYARLDECDGQTITLAFLQKINENEGEKETMAVKKVKEVYSIREENTKSREILEEMKAKVDRKRLQQLLSISASSIDDKVFVKNDMVDKYLELWANAKYEYYIMFGGQLKLEKEIEQEITERDMENLVNDLRMQNPKYAFWLDKFASREYIENKVIYGPTSSIRQVVDYCTTGMKLSGFFSKLFKDEQFDIELSKVMQNKYVKGYITVSIDPYDYLTSSLNKHLWKSCHRITDGEYGTGSLSYLLDDTTMIAYKHNGRDYDYNYYNFKFTGNSKTFRQCVYFDKSSCNIIFGRNYPNSNTSITNEVMQLLQNQVCNHLGLPIESRWIKATEEYEGLYEDLSELHYSDVENGWRFTFTRLEDSLHEVANFKVGYNVPCLICGDAVEVEGECAICSDCYDERNYNDDDEDDDY